MKEISRTIDGKVVVVKYDNGTAQAFDLDRSPENVTADAETAIPAQGHTFTHDDLVSRGYEQ